MVKLTNQVINAFAIKISKAINEEIEAYNASIKSNWKSVQEKQLKYELDIQLDPILDEFNKAVAQYEISANQSDSSWFKTRVVNAIVQKSYDSMSKNLKKSVDFQDIKNEIILSSIDATTIADIEEAMRKKFLND